MVPIQNVKMAVGPIWNTGGTKTEIIVPVSVMGPQRAGTEMGCKIVKITFIWSDFFNSITER